MEETTYRVPSSIITEAGTNDKEHERRSSQTYER